MSLYSGHPAIALLFSRSSSVAPTPFTPSNSHSRSNSPAASRTNAHRSPTTSVQREAQVPVCQYFAGIACKKLNEPERAERAISTAPRSTPVRTSNHYCPSTPATLYISAKFDIAIPSSDTKPPNITAGPACGVIYSTSPRIRPRS
ncbi:hypothetical protein BDZ91DRAFT_3721 [Kalaharituber pfeilii]|nr:hypothetical protein BDZ91DRAFT_3721 [Kalaharituber pfeilii]